MKTKLGAFVLLLAILCATLIGCNEEESPVKKEPVPEKDLALAMRRLEHNGYKAELKTEDYNGDSVPETILQATWDSENGSGYLGYWITIIRFQDTSSAEKEYNKNKKDWEEAKKESPKYNSFCIGISEKMTWVANNVSAINHTKVANGMTAPPAKDPIQIKTALQALGYTVQIRTNVEEGMDTALVAAEEDDPSTIALGVNWYNNNEDAYEAYLYNKDMLKYMKASDPDTYKDFVIGKSGNMVWLAKSQSIVNATR